MVAALERVATVPELAAEAGVSTKTMRKRLLRLHEKHGGPWLLRFGEREYAVNRSLLKATHPYIFERALATQAELNDLREQVDLLKKRQNSLAKQFHGQANAWFRRGTGKTLEDPR